MTQVLVTGANGFVGKNLYQALRKTGYDVRGAVRNKRNNDDLSGDSGLVYTGDIGPGTDWVEAIERSNVVVHLAGRAHILRETAKDPLAEFRRINVAGTESLARVAANVGVRRFIFISSIGVNGNTTSGSPFLEQDQPRPHNAYAVSKFEAEQVLRRVAQETGLEIVVIRPPLVYGPGVGANFRKLMNWLNRGIPLPLGAIRNKRSLVALDNIVDLIIKCIEHPAAAHQTFLVSDGEDLSTTALLVRLGQAMGKPARLLPIPQKLLEASLRILGKDALLQQLCGSLQVDISKARMLLGWEPPVAVDKGLRQTAEAFLQPGA